MIRFYNRYRQAKTELGVIGAALSFIKNRYPVHKSLIYMQNREIDFNSRECLHIERYTSAENMKESLYLNLSKTSGPMAIRLKRPEGLPPGHVAWVGTVGGEFVGVCWSRGKERWDCIFRNMDHSDSYIWGCIVRYEFRGRGIFPAMLSQINKRLLDDGQKNIYIDCKVNNKASIRGIEKAGFQYIGHAWVLAIGHKRKVLSRHTISDYNGRTIKAL